MTDEDQIRAMLDRYEAAVLARDAEAALADYAEDAIGYDLAPPLLHGPGQIHDVAGLRSWFDTWDGPIRISHLEPTIFVDGALGVVHGLQRMQGTRKGEAESDLWFRYTIALRRIGGVWKIVHIHTSVPMAMDGSGKALTDLKP